MFDELIKQLAGYEINIITESNCKDLLEVITSNGEYFRLFEDGTANDQTCAEMINSVPPNFDIHNKLFLGLWKHGQAVAIIDILMQYPQKNSIWISLLLVHEQMHGQGIGRTIDHALVKAAQKNGYISIQLGVIDENKQALFFWQKLDYRITGSKTAISHPGRDIYLLQKEII